MVKTEKAQWKAAYFQKLTTAFDEYPKCFLVEADNVGSRQMQQIRMSLRGHAVVLMGKNTMMRKAIRGHLAQDPKLEQILPHIIGNIGFVFTKEELTDVRALILENKVKAPARAGAIAPLDVTVPAQNTGLGPEKTSFFQALNIPTKITKGTIEIIADVKLIKEGDKVGMSDSTLLNMLKISPFTYGLIVKKVYDSGTVFDPAILDVTDDDIKEKFMAGVRNVAALSLQIRYPNTASVPHSIVNGMKKCMALAAVTNITFKEAVVMKEYLADPSKFATVAPATGAAAPTADAGAKEEKNEEPEEESDDDMGFGLFD